MRHLCLPLLSIGICLVMTLAGCQQATSTSVPSSSSSSPSELSKPTDITLALNWFPEAEHGGFYAALVHGYYEEEGLKVTIRPGGPGVRVIADVASGVVNFGVDNADKLLVWRAQQADAVAVMGPIQDSPRCIMVHKNSGLTKLEDLASKRPFTLGINSDQPFAQFLKKRVDLADVQIVKYPGNVAQFLENSDYGQQAYSFSEPFLAQQKEGDPLCLMLSELGFNTYTSLLIAPREMIDKQPELVEKMTRASIRGWQKYLAEPEATNKYIHEQNREMGLDVLQFGAAELKPLCLPKDFPVERFGELTAERWQTLADQMVEIGSLKADTVKAEEAFTTKFLNSGR
jgi:NitT/TauT family transport system substrate-binding protein